MVEFSLANAADFIDEDEDVDEEPGEEIESAPPLSVGEEREISSSGIKKKLIKCGICWETPEVGDEVTVHFVGKLLEGTRFTSTRDKDEAFTFKIGTCQVVSGLDHAIVTMRKGEIALFTIPPELGYGAGGTEAVPPNSSIQFEVELVSWIAVVDVCKDCGIIKKVMEKGEEIGPPGDLDEVRVRYTAVLDDDTVVAETPEEGMEFHVKDGHFCPALPKAIKTMKKGEKVKLIIQPQYAFEERKENKSDFSSPDLNSTLRIDLELLSFKPVIDVTGDSKILKKIFKEGEGFTANEGASVTVRYTAMLEDGIVFEKKGVDAGEPMEFVTDEEQVVAGLDRAAMTMKKGEVALLTIHPEFGFGSVEMQRDLATIPPSSTIIYEIEMLDFTREKAPWEVSDQERIEAAKRKKEEGNLLFRNGKYQRAGKKYDKAMDYVTEDGSFRENDLKVVKSLRILCWLNGAACSIRVNDFQEAIKLCSKVLDVESSNVKALYRRAQAYVGSADLYLAELDIKRALENDPQNREVKLLHKNVRQLQAESSKRDANLYSTMFSGRRKGTSPATKRLKIGNGEDRKLIEDVITTEMEKAAVNSESPDEGMAVDSC